MKEYFKCIVGNAWRRPYIHCYVGLSGMNNFIGLNKPP